jgi:hypothetical protein
MSDCLRMKHVISLDAQPRAADPLGLASLLQLEDHYHDYLIQI